MIDLEIKTERLVEMLQAQKLGGVFINSQHNFAWLTSGGKNGVDLSRENGVSSILVRNDGKRFLIASKIEMPRMLAEEVSQKDFEPLEFAWEDEKANGNLPLEIASQSLLGNSKLATDIFYNISVPAIEGVIAHCRYRLTSFEQAKFRTLCAETADTIQGIHRFISPGLSEIEIANIVKCELRKKDIAGVVTLVAADDRIKKFRHPIPTVNAWKKTLMIVVCAKRDGLIASLSRIFSLGSVSDDLRRQTDAVAKVHATIMSETRIGKTGSELFEVLKAAYSANGFPGEENFHHQGGACGYKTRDWVAHSKSKEIVCDNQAFAFNPSISGTKAEDTFLVSDGGVELLSVAGDFPRIVNRVAGQDYPSPDILVL